VRAWAASCVCSATGSACERKREAVLGYCCLLVDGVRECEEGLKSVGKRCGADL